jgi:uncharacterized Ntn-hydrolase superfamily protein
LEASDPYVEWRQIGVIDRWGHTAVRTGSENSEWAGHLTGDGFIVMGNRLVSEGVVVAMAKAMEDIANDEIEIRLMRAIDAGTNAGGQPNGQRSAAILVYENEGYSIINLRVDDSDSPMAELQRLFKKLYPLLPYYKERPENPTIGTVSDWAKARGLNV